MIGRLAWVTTRGARGRDEDEQPASAALERTGVTVEVVDRDDPAVDWSRFDRAVLRSTWDYTRRLPEFRSWIDEVDAVTDLVNPAATVRWNLDKRYLAELAAAGMPVIPTDFVAPGAAATFPAGDVVVKPAVGAGSRDAASYGADQHEAAAAHVARLLLVAFGPAERRAADPILPPWVFRRRLLLTTILLSLGIGVMLIGLTSFVPTYLQNAHGVSPLVAGLALTALTIGWPSSASLSGQLFHLRFGFRPKILIGLAVVVIAVGVLALLAHGPSVVVVAVTCFVAGLGMGLVASPSLIAAQASVEWNERGVATGTNIFARSIGSAAGLTMPQVHAPTTGAPTGPG